MELIVANLKQQMNIADGGAKVLYNQRLSKPDMHIG